MEIKRGKLFKKSWSVIISMFLVLSMALIGCSSSNSTNNNQAKPNDAAQKPNDKAPAKQDAKKIVIGFSQATMNHPWRVAMVEQNKKYAEENLKDVDLVITDGNNQATKQVADVEDLIARKVDVLVISPLTEDALTPVVKKAMDAGIKVVTLDRKVNTPVTLHIGGDNLMIGKAAADLLTKKLNGKGNIVEIQGTAGASATNDRDKGFRDEIKNAAGLKIVGTQNADFLREPAMKYMEDMLQRFGPGQIQAVYAHNDEMALGALKAIEAAGRQNEIAVVGADGENLAIEAIKAGKMLGTVTYPFCAPEGVQYAYKLAKGEKFPPQVVLEDKVIEPSNVDQWIGKGF